MKQIKEFLQKVANQTERVERGCPGNHTYYSSMHPNIGSCGICGRSEDGLGANITTYEPTKLAKEAKELLKLL